MRALSSQLGQGFMDKAAAATEYTGDLSNGPTFRPKGLQLDRVNGNGLATDSEALGAAICNPGLYPLAYEVALKFGERSDHIEHQSTGGCSQVETIAQANERNTKGLKLA